MFSKFTLVAVVVSFALGLGAGWVVFANAGQPCWEVRAALEDAQDERVESFGEDGRDALRVAAAGAADRPDCFSPRELESLRQLAEMPPQPSRDDATPGEATAEPTELGTVPG